MTRPRGGDQARSAGRGPLLLVTVLLAAAPAATATAAGAGAAGGVNPISLLEDASTAIPGFDGGLSGSLNILILLTVLTLAPAILILCTCFTRLVIVLGLLRQALGTQGTPPAQVIVGLSLFMTFVVMAPTFQRMYDEGIAPYATGQTSDYQLTWQRSKQPLRDFMFAQIDATGNWSGVYMIMDYRGIDVSNPQDLTRSDVDMLTLVPAYVLSELKVAFLMGFRIYLPFLIIDMVIASMLISMGMLMLPPVLISLPFKLLLFVLVDGWQLIAGSLMKSFIQPQETMDMISTVMSGP